MTVTLRRDVSERRPTRRDAALWLIAFASAALTAIFYAPFTAEDAFITYRYAANLATHGALVFNEGEPVLALTSPLHGGIAALLFRVTGNPVLWNKVLALVLLAVVARFLHRRYRGYPHVQLLGLALVVLPPCVLLWTFGGLETPVLLFIATWLVLLADRDARPGLGRLSAVLGLAGLAFLTRYDSVLFSVPIAVHVLWRSASLRNAALACAVAAVLPLAWLAGSYHYYGDLLPTSFYSKTPTLSSGALIGHGRYIAAYLLFTGIVPVAAFAVWLLHRSGRGLQVGIAHARRYGWLYCAIAAQLAYGLTMAKTHMMFSFRFFVPYLPAAAILFGDLVRGALDAHEAVPRRRPDRLLVAFVFAMVLFQAGQSLHAYTFSINGIGRIAGRVEYGSVGVGQYTTFIRTLQRQGQDIERHWLTLASRPDRLPRIYTFAGGVVPYTFRESYVYETLVSYRHCTDSDSLFHAPNFWVRTGTDLRRAADYIHLITPRHGELQPQLPLPLPHYEQVSSHELVFAGARERLIVFYNPAPEPHRLVPRIDDLCGDGRTGRRRAP